MKNSADLGECYPPRPTASVDNTLLDLQNSSYPTQPHSIIAKYTFKALHGAAPSYITDLIKPYTPGRLLRSSNQFLLSTSKFNLKTYGGFLVLDFRK